MNTLHKTKNDLSANTRKSIVDLLGARLSDALDLVAQAKQAHWNVKGPSFIALHELFDTIYTQAVTDADTIAERLVALGGIAQGTVQVTAKSSTLPPYPLEAIDGIAHCEGLSTALAAFGKQVRAAIEAADSMGDADTADLFTAMSRDCDKNLWLVEAHLQAKH